MPIFCNSQFKLLHVLTKLILEFMLRLKLNKDHFQLNKGEAKLSRPVLIAINYKPACAFPSFQLRQKAAIKSVHCEGIEPVSHAGTSWIAPLILDILQLSIIYCLLMRKIFNCARTFVTERKQFYWEIGSVHFFVIQLKRVVVIMKLQ